MLNTMKPDYQHSIVNLMANIADAHGGVDTGYTPLASLPDEALSEGTTVLMVIDGLGQELLRRFPDSFLAQYQIDTLSSVFPSTTASAITAFSSGVAAQQHAITGWFTWLRELGCVASILPFMPRGSTCYLADSGAAPDDIIQAPPLPDRLSSPTVLLSPHYINDSPYSAASWGSAKRVPHDGMRDFFKQLGKLLGVKKRHFIFAYWTELDSLSHQFGVDSHETRFHFRMLDKALQEFCFEMAGKQAQLLITADHGLIDTDPAKTIRLSDYPDLEACLTVPLCGEPRAAFAYVRPRSVEQFESIITQELHRAIELVPSEELIADGYFGCGTPSEALLHRVGDYALLMKDNYVIKDQLLTEQPFAQIGVHGGLSKQEMRVPLVQIPL